MAQYLNPFTGKPLGWDDGENGWGQPLNSTLIQYAFYLNRNVKGILASPDLLPVSPNDGDAYLVVSNARVYYYSKQWYNDIPPNGMKFRLTTTGKYFTKQGPNFVQDEEFANVAYSGNAGDLTGKLSYNVIPEFIGDVTKPENSAQLTLANTGVVAGSYGLTTGLSFPRFTVDSKGRITSVVNQLIPDATTTTSGLMSGADKTKLNGLAVQVNSDWNSVSGFSQILNKPTLGSLAALSSVNDSNWSGTALSVDNGGTGANNAASARANLGLTSLATTTVDATTNRLMKVGAGGILGYTTDIEDGDLLGSSGGLWRVPAASTSLGANGYMVNISRDSASSGQMFITDTGRILTRTKNSNVWQSWTEAYTNKNLLNIGTTPASARTALSLGSLATLSSVNNSNWSGTALSIANGGTGANNAASARANLGIEIGDFATTQYFNSVAEMVALPASSPIEYAVVRSYMGTGNGGGGIFKFNPSGTVNDRGWSISRTSGGT